jgi:hypothetical protein
MTSIDRVEVRRLMVGPIHVDSDAVELAQRLGQSGRARDRIIGVEQRRCLAVPTTGSRPEPLRTGYSPRYPQAAAGTSISLTRHAIDRSLRAVVMPATAEALRLPRH